MILLFKKTNKYNLYQIYQILARINRHFGKIISRSTCLNLQVTPLTKYSTKTQTWSDRNKSKIQILKQVRNIQSTRSLQECFKIIWLTEFERQVNNIFLQLRRWELSFSVNVYYKLNWTIPMYFHWTSTWETFYSTSLSMHTSSRHKLAN